MTLIFLNIVKSHPNINKLKQIEELGGRSCVRKSSTQGTKKSLYIQRIIAETQIKLLLIL